MCAQQTEVCNLHSAVDNPRDTTHTHVPKRPLNQLCIISVAPGMILRVVA